MNTLIKICDSKTEMYRQLYRGQISETALIARMEIKDEQMAIELRRMSALLCATCEEIGRPEHNVVSIEFGPTIEPEQ